MLLKLKRIEIRNVPRSLIHDLNISLNQCARFPTNKILQVQSAFQVSFPTLARVHRILPIIFQFIENQNVYFAKNGYFQYRKYVFKRSCLFLKLCWNKKPFLNACFPRLDTFFGKIYISVTFILSHLGRKNLFPMQLWENAANIMQKIFTLGELEFDIVIITETNFRKYT